MGIDSRDGVGESTVSGRGERRTRVLWTELENKKSDWWVRDKGIWCGLEEVEG
jgi:hypothetical protein